MSGQKKLGILCGGGPAPGMNSVISSATIHAINNGYEVIGILDGFKHLIDGKVDQVKSLSVEDVSRIHHLGGSILFTSRANPTVRDDKAADPEWRLHRCLQALKGIGVEALLTIGGDDTAYSASRLAAKAQGSLRVVHVPKTIDNDLPLPGGMPTFGFETARHVGVEIVNNLMTDARTSRRWFIVVAMGRSAGHLALGIGKAASATVTIIAEEFPKDSPIHLSMLVDRLETTMLKRMAQGHPYGVAVLSEGIGLRLSLEELEKAAVEIERDEHGHIRLSEIQLHRILTKLLKDRFKARNQSPTIVAKTVGYELRCAPPIPFDVEYTRDLGHGAIEYLRRQDLAGSTELGAMVTMQSGKLVPMPFGSFADPKSGRTLVREVNINTESYQVATHYMIRLTRDDLQDPARLAALAEAAKTTPEDFAARFAYLVEGAVRHTASRT